MGRKLESLDSPIPEKVEGLKREFCATIRREAKKLKVPELAEKLGISEDYLRKLISGARSPDLNSLQPWAKALGYASWHEFFKPVKRHE